MKQKICEGKFTVEIKDGYLEGGKYTRKDKTAVIRLYAEQELVTLDEVADAIVACTFWCSGLGKIIDSKRFFNLDIYLEISKGDGVTVTYNFKIPYYNSTKDILPAIAAYITL